MSVCVGAWKLPGIVLCTADSGCCDEQATPKPTIVDENEYRPRRANSIVPFHMLNGVLKRAADRPTQPTFCQQQQANAGNSIYIYISNTFFSRISHSHASIFYFIGLASYMCPSFRRRVCDGLASQGKRSEDGCRAMRGCEGACAVRVRGETGRERSLQCVDATSIQFIRHTATTVHTVQN